MHSQILANLASYHKPILLSLQNIQNLGSIPFKYNPQWITTPGFSETVRNAWGQPISSSPSFVWEQKIKNTKVALKEWAKTISKTSFKARQERSPPS